MLAAPLGVVAVAFMNVVGAQILRSWDTRVAQDALRMFQSEAMEGVKKFAGYLVGTLVGMGARGLPLACIRTCHKQQISIMLRSHGCGFSGFCI